MYLDIYIYIYICIYVCMYVCMYVCTYAYMSVCTYVRMYVCTYECMSSVCSCPIFSILFHVKSVSCPASVFMLHRWWVTKNTRNENLLTRKSMYIYDLPKISRTKYQSRTMTWILSIENGDFKKREIWTTLYWY